MATYQKVLLSGSTNGRPISVVATSSPGTTIHTVSSTADVLDEIYLWVVNVSGGAVPLTLQVGGTGASDEAPDTMPVDAHSEPIPILPGIPLSGGVIIRAYAGTTAVLNIFGYVNRISG